MDLPWKPLYQQQESNDSTTETTWITEYALAATLLFTAAVYAWEAFLDARQYQAYCSTIFPVHLQTTVSQMDKEALQKDKEHKPLLPTLQDKFAKAQAYGRDKMRLGMVSSLYDVVESMAFLLLGFLPYVWDKAAAYGFTEIPTSLIFVGLTTVVSTVTSLPFEVYSQFVVERRHNFSKMTPGLFIVDKIKSSFLTAAIGGPFLALLLWIIQQTGPYYYVYVWVFLLCFSILMMTLVPTVIMPLFNKYEPLPDGDLRTRIYALADELQYPLTKLFVMDGSKRSSHSNAFMFGFGRNKRIVLFDTLLTQVSDDEILAILGHELGHWKLGHTLSNFCITQVYTAAAFGGFAWTMQQGTELFGAFGFADNVPTLIALLLFFQTLWAPVDKMLSFLLTLFSRYNEFGADAFAVSLGRSQALQSGLCKIHVENLGCMAPDVLYSTYHYSHPPLVERLSAMMENTKKTQ